VDAFDQAARLRQYLKEAGRSALDFGFHCNMIRAKTPETVVETARRWREIGGTHASVSTMGQKLTTTEQHVDYLKRVAEALRQAGALG
jgi:alkanesulfonate monooxygenase SsuD/methylene tetrahydromethanopterin reductase-like flavin-dependent oxidoreductase (luciferase family)